MLLTVLAQMWFYVSLITIIIKSTWSASVICQVTHVDFMWILILYTLFWFFLSCYSVVIIFSYISSALIKSFLTCIKWVKFRMISSVFATMLRQLHIIFIIFLNRISLLLWPTQTRHIIARSIISIIHARASSTCLTHFIAIIIYQYYYQLFLIKFHFYL